MLKSIYRDLNCAIKNKIYLKINEVTMRDGLQSIKDPIVPANTKLEIINKLGKVGFNYLEIGSFVSEKAVPQMKTTTEILQRVKQLDYHKNTKLGILVASQSGFDTAMKYIDTIREKNIKIAFVTSPSDSFCKTNMKMESNKSLEFVNNSILSLEAYGIDTRIYISCCFHNPDKTKMETKKCSDFIKNLKYKFNKTEFVISDTFGCALPHEVYTLLYHIKNNYSPNDITMHFHDGKNMNDKIIASVFCGITSFDTTITSNLGGCSSFEGTHNNLTLKQLYRTMNEYDLYDTLELKNLIGIDKMIEKALQK